MRMLISGGTGFIGSFLAEYFLNAKNSVSVLTRDAKKPYSLPRSVTLIEDLTRCTEPFDVILNFAGESLFNKRWSPEFKKIIRESRLGTTKKILDYIKTARVKPKLLISGSAVGYYGNAANADLTEDSFSATLDFASELCRDWENEAKKAEQFGVRVCLSRTGIVLGRKGGALQQMRLPFKCGLGAILGSGQQWMSWIHMNDLAAGMDFLIQNTGCQGPFNLSAPNPIRNEIFTKTLAKTLNRPSFLKFPPKLVKILFGEMGETLLLASQRALPEKLLKAGFSFKFSDLESALQDIFKN